MPLPLGHTAIGLLTHEAAEAPPPAGERLKWFLIVTILANLPDTDVIFGLLMNGNGSLFHRGPTHSLLFAVMAGCLISFLSRYWRVLPTIRCRTAVALILSHVIADALFTAAPVSFLWPLEVNFSAGHSGWTDVIRCVVFEGFRDVGLVAASVLLIMGIRLVRSRRHAIRRPLFRSPSA
ncbi:MAG: metal-dependent hydrolase [Desulfosarcinaceae bacterium]|nr:metal-dependent hydrolase [Desulfosarcinaceae bacterium]